MICVALTETGQCLLVPSMLRIFELERIHFKIKCYFKCF